VCVCVCVAIHALASMPSAQCLSEADSKTSTTTVCSTMLICNSSTMLMCKQHIDTAIHRTIVVPASMHSRSDHAFLRFAADRKLTAVYCTELLQDGCKHQHDQYCKAIQICTYKRLIYELVACQAAKQYAAADIQNNTMYNSRWATACPMSSPDH
jgi:hypothetical protein